MAELYIWTRSRNRGVYNIEDGNKIFKTNRVKI